MTTTPVPKKPESEKQRALSRDRRGRSPLTDTELPRLSSGPVAPETRRGRRIALTVVVVFAFLTVAWIVSPLWVGVALGTVMAFTAQPIYRRLARRLGDRRTIAAAFTTAVTGLLSTAATVLAGYIVVRELVTLVALFQRKMSSGTTLQSLIGDRAAHVVDKLGVDRVALMARIHRELGAATEYATSAAATVVQATTSAAVGLVIALMTMYYVLLEWPNIAVRLERVLPLDPRHTRALILEFRDVGRSSFVGTIATAIVQGLLGGVGFAIAGVSNAVTWATLTAIASFIPLVGTSLVWAPMAVYLLVSGEPLGGVFVAAWGLLVVMALSDYVIRPRLVGGKEHGHPLLMLIALLGGIEVFGLAGLIVAPMLMSLFLAALRIYEREVEADDLPDRRKRRQSASGADSGAESGTSAAASAVSSAAIPAAKATIPDRSDEP